MTFEPLSVAVSTLLDKAAADNGFDMSAADTNGWLPFASTHAPLRLWLTAAGNAGPYIAALSMASVAQALEIGESTSTTLPLGAVAARAVGTLSDLHRLVRRAFRLANTLPDELLHEFEKATSALVPPPSTEVERLVKQRVGQSIFRTGLLNYWEGRCAATGLAVTDLLRASHIKPWASCTNDAERLDVFNGLLLAPHLDAAFDAGYITWRPDGVMLVSPSLAESERPVLGLDASQVISKLVPQHAGYLAWHFEHVFRG